MAALFGGGRRRPISRSGEFWGRCGGNTGGKGRAAWSAVNTAADGVKREEPRRTRGGEEEGGARRSARGTDEPRGVRPFRPRTSISAGRIVRGEGAVTWPPSPSRNDALSRPDASFILNCEVNAAAYSNTRANPLPCDTPIRVATRPARKTSFLPSLPPLFPRFRSFSSYLYG